MIFVRWWLYTLIHWTAQARVAYWSRPVLGHRRKYGIAPPDFERKYSRAKRQSESAKKCRLAAAMLAQRRWADAIKRVWQ